MREYLTLTNIIILYFCITIPIGFVVAMRKVRRDREVLRGRLVQARVVSLRDTGERYNSRVTAELTLEVEGRQVVTRCSVPPLATPRFQPGSLLPVRVHPTEPDRVLVDLAALES